jgi:hypothetical protein
MEEKNMLTANLNNGYNFFGGAKNLEFYTDIKISR